MKYVLSALVAVLALGWLAGPLEARVRMREQAKPAATPEQFIQKVASSNQLGIQASQLALDKSKNDEVRHFAQRMIDDHTKLGDELKSTLQQANLPVPEAQLEPKDEAQLNTLKRLNGAAFDRTYMAGQRQDHITVVQLVGTYSKSGTNQPLKELAAKAMPVLQGHLKMVEAMRGGHNVSARR